MTSRRRSSTDCALSVGLNVGSSYAHAHAHSSVMLVGTDDLPPSPTTHAPPTVLPQVHYGWNGYFTAMIGACVVSLALMLPLANAKSYVQLQKEGKAAA